MTYPSKHARRRATLAARQARATALQDRRHAIAERAEELNK